MKKFLLIAAMAALALGASADGYKFEKVWELNTASIGLDKGHIRQGFGMNGKFYINDKSTQTVYEVGEEGLTGVTFPGGRNCGITRDEAGNIVVSDAAFPGNWVDAKILVINPTTGATKEYDFPDCGLTGRCDFLGFAQGNLFEDGALYLTAKTPGTDPVVYTDGIVVFTVTDGEVDSDNCYLAPCDILIGDNPTNRDNMTVLNYYKDINGVPTALYVFRSYNGNDVVKLPLNDNFEVGINVDLPGKGACAGAHPFIWDGKEFFVYPTTPNYLNGFAISEANAEEPLFTVPATVSANMNAFQCNWQNAEVDADGVTIYQYAPGANFAVWRLTKDEPVPEPQNVYMIGGDDQGWDPTSGTLFDYDAENNVYTATITFPAEYNYFGFTTELAENNDDGGWAYIEPFRFGAIADEGTDYWYTGEEEFISLTWDDYHAIRIPGGEYKMTVNLADMKLIIEPVITVLRGDVNKDGNINIGDVTALINHVLSKDYIENEDFSPANADVNNDETWNVADVTMLINYVLSKNWPE